MSDLKKTENIEEGHQKPELCVNCHEFFGNKHNDDLCSKCYRTKFNKASTKPGSQSADLISKAATLTSRIQENLQSVKKDQSLPVEEKKSEEPVVVENKQVEAHAPKQKDMSRCYQCNKKVGLLGFKCQCELVYCRNHRLPEAHTCSFDFSQAGKDRLAKENVMVKADKVERLRKQLLSCMMYMAAALHFFCK